ncbi:MAG: 2-keto-4-pentenoate hydratase [Hyphomonas sp. BRH_c22]|uniref:2-keto-4-pentenoate hydratase n=1 Tax=Hyphomonas sp. BRH_c22 TaxID=1629710 RepID=UPI0005F0C674|nr:fumarylacetoacetate hydrolase family protein [Hyphomonas sp. BRH_c22]KJS36312.1 MAG: 2-keto-4-pentenoate hydratase [Hyphomonas sp. BRH_c22]
MSLNTKDRNAAALSLRQVYEGGNPVSPLRDRFLGIDVNDSYAIQQINTQYWLDQGRTLCGRKIGLTSTAVQAQLGVDQPDFGMLFSDMSFADGEAVPISRLYQPKIEGEIAFYLDRDLDDPAITLAELVRAIAFALPAIEIVDSRVKDWDISIVDTIADNASSGLYVLGSRPVALSDFDHLACGMVVEHRGQPVSVGAGAACLGNPLNACLWLARKMIEVGAPLKAGDLILSGALGPMVPVTPGVYELRINGLGSVSARFADC